MSGATIRITVMADDEWETDPVSLWGSEDDVPEEVDAHAVEDLIARNGGGLIGLGQLFGDLNVEIDITVEMPNPHYRQAEALFPELAPPPVIRSKAWTS